MEKRNVKEANVARETIYGVVETMVGAAVAEVGYEMVGRATEGIIFRDVANDTYVVVKAIAKGLEFDAEDAMDEYEEKAVKAAEKVAKAKAKAEKDIAKRAKDKAEKAEVEA